MSIQKLLYQNVLWKGLFYLSGFILNILIAKYLGAALSGKFYYLISIFAFITLITSVSLESGIVFYGSKNKISHQSLLSFSIVWTFLSTIIIAVIFYSIIFFSKINFEKNLLRYLLLFVSGNILTTFLGAIYYSQKKFIIPGITGLIINIIFITLLLVTSMDKRLLSTDNFFLIYFCSFFFNVIIMSAFMLTDLPKPVSFVLPDVYQVKLLFRYCLIAFSANIISFLLYRVDYWFVDRYCNSEQLGNYIQVSKLAQIFFVLPGILASTVFPLTAGNHSRQMNNSLMILSRTLFFFYGVLCLIVAVTGAWLFPFIFGNSFNGMYVPFLFLIPGILGLSTLYTLSAYYAGKNKISVNIKGSLFALFFMIIADIIFVPKFGINAAAAVSSISYIIFHIYVLSIFTKEYNVKAINFFQFKFSDFQIIRNYFLKA